MTSRLDFSDHMIGRELKRLRLKRSATLSRQRQRTNDVVPDEHSLYPLTESRYNRLVEEIYTKIDKCNFFVFEDNESSGTEGSSLTEATTSSSSADQEQELIVTALSSPTRPPRYEGERDHDIDTKVFHAGNKLEQQQQQQPNIDQNMSKKQESTHQDQTSIRRSDDGPLVVDSPKLKMNVADGEIKSTLTMEKVTTRKPRSLEDRRRARLRERRKFEKFLRGEDELFSVSSSVVSEDRLQLKEQHRHHRSKNSLLDDRNYEYTQTNDSTSVNSPSNHDSCGFGKLGYTAGNKFHYDATTHLNVHDAASIGAGSSLSDTFEFIIEQNAISKVEEAIPRPLRRLESSNLSIASFGFPDDETVGASQSDHGNQFTIKYEQKKQARNICLGDCGIIGDDETSTKSIKKTESSEMLSKARRLRALRLRLAALGRNGTEIINLGELNQEEKLEEKDYVFAAEYGGHSGQIIRVHSKESRSICSKSVISEISIASDKLLSKLDELSILCGSDTSTTSDSEIEYERRMRYEELKPPNIEEASLPFDSSVKTPPRHHLDPDIKDRFEREREISFFRYPSPDQSKWDDTSSIGAIGADTINRRRESSKAIPRENKATTIAEVPLDNRPPGKKPDQTFKDGEEKNRNGQKSIFRRIICLVDDIDERNEESQGTSFYVKGKCPSKSLKSTPALHLNQALSSAVSSEDDCTSYYGDYTEGNLMSIEKRILRLKAEQPKLQSLWTSTRSFQHGRIFHSNEDQIYSC